MIFIIKYKETGVKEKMMRFSVYDGDSIDGPVPDNCSELVGCANLAVKRHIGLLCYFAVGRLLCCADDTDDRHHRAWMLMLRDLYIYVW